MLYCPALSCAVSCVVLSQNSKRQNTTAKPRQKHDNENNEKNRTKKKQEAKKNRIQKSKRETKKKTGQGKTRQDKKGQGKTCLFFFIFVFVSDV
jgi:hypothetical protein